MLRSSGDRTLAGATYCAGQRLMRLRRALLLVRGWSRRLAGVVAGGAYLAAVLVLEPRVAVALSATAVALLLARFCAPRAQRTPGRGWGELSFAGAATASLAIGWGIAGDRWIAFSAIAFVAWGDNSAGVVRAALDHRLARYWGSLAMLAVCLAICVVVQPYWVGVAGAVVAAVVERVRPIAHRGWDDNWTIPLLSLFTMLAATTTS